MNNNNTVLTATPLDEVFRQWFDVIKIELRTEIKAALDQEAGERLLSPSDACKVFSPKISRGTLQAWTDAGHLKRYDIGGRVYYRYRELLDGARSLKRYKR